MQKFFKLGPAYKNEWRSFKSPSWDRITNKDVTWDDNFPYGFWDKDIFPSRSICVTSPPPFSYADLPLYGHTYMISHSPISCNKLPLMVHVEAKSWRLPLFWEFLATCVYKMGDLCRHLNDVCALMSHFVYFSIFRSRYQLWVF